MDVGPVEKLSPELAGRLEKMLAGGQPVTLTAYGHPALVVPLEGLLRGRPIHVHVERDGLGVVVMPSEMYESLMETLDVLGDADAMEAIRAARAETGEDYSLDEVRQLVAERDE